MQTIHMNLDLRRLDFGSVVVVCYRVPIEACDGCSKFYLISCDLGQFKYLLVVIL